jgi:hypothetical protein
MHVLTGIPVDPSTYLTWGWLSVSVPNLIMMVVTVVLFVLALVVPFPSGREEPAERRERGGRSSTSGADRS